MNSLALSGLDYRKPLYFGGGGRGKRHNQPLEPVRPGAVGGTSGSGATSTTAGSTSAGGSGSSSALPAGAIGGSGESGTGYAGTLDGRDYNRDYRSDAADTNQSQTIGGICGSTRPGGPDQLDFQEPGSEDAAAQAQYDPGDKPGEGRYRGKYRGSGAVTALFGARQTIAEGHLPPWLLPGYGADGNHWPATGAPQDNQTRNWKKPSECWNKEPDPDQESRPFANDVAASKYENVGSHHPTMELDPAELLDQPHDCNKAGCQRVIINVSGQRYETQLRTLNRFPDTLLGDPMKRKPFWDSRRNEFFIDRHRPSFQAILYYYQSGGRLRRPIEVPEDIFLEELEFYEFDEVTIKEYKENEGFLMDELKPMPENKYFRYMWMFVEEPDTSRAARVFAVISVACIMVSIISFCLETLPNFERKQCVNVTTDGGMSYHQAPNYSDVFFIIESVCVAWFTVEFIIRAITCPSKFQFCKNIMNIFDVMAILPYFITLITIAADSECHSSNKGGSFVFIRVLRVFRIFKLGKHSQGLRILGLTIKSSLRELGMFFFFLVVAMVIFSSAAYYAEAGEPDSQLTSIPGAFWWAIVTMTTVGYGDVTPVGVWGKMVGSICVIAGVLTIALPVPVVVANFNNFYRRGSGGAGGGG